MLARTKKTPCSRLHARKSGHRAAAHGRGRAGSLPVAKYGTPWGEAYGTHQRVYTLWWHVPRLGPPPWPPMVPTSAARRPIALRREPTFLASVPLFVFLFCLFHGPRARRDPASDDDTHSIYIDRVRSDSAVSGALKSCGNWKTEIGIEWYYRSA